MRITITEWIVGTLVCIGLFLLSLDRTYSVPIEEVPKPELFVKVNKSKYTNQDRECLLEALWHESRGESFVGQVAVAHVILNRVESSEFPNTICEVVHEIKPVCQFSYYCDGKSDKIKVTEENAWLIAHVEASADKAIWMYERDINLMEGILYYQVNGKGLRVGNHAFRE